MHLNQGRFSKWGSSILVAVLVLSFTFLASALQADRNVSKIITLDAEPDYSHRYHSLHRLTGSELSGNAQELIAFMRAEQVPEGMHEAEYMSLVNDIYNLLLENRTEVRQLFDICLEVIPDESAGRIWRDYCMQKLGYTLDRDDIAPEKIQSALKLLDAATQGAYPRMQGTAFIVAYLHKDHPFEPKPGFLDERILGARALSAARDDSKPLIDRITALQTATKCGHPGTLGYALSIINAVGRVEPMLKVVAIASVGQLGGRAQLPLLDEYRLSADVRFREAARAARQKLQNQS